MKLLKKILIFLFIVLIAIQAAFVYRRYKFGQLRAKIDEIAKTSQALPKPTNTNFNEFKGIIHAHTGLGGHSTGRFEELIDASNSNDLDFVVMTEHFSPQFDTSALAVLLECRRTVLAQGRTLQVQGLPVALQQISVLYGVDGLLGVSAKSVE